MSSVPKGSVLFVLQYMNDLPDIVSEILKIFADYVQLHGTVGTPAQIQAIHDDINNICNWSANWQLEFSADECNVFNLSNNNPEYTYAMTTLNGTTEITVPEAEKDLGVLIDKDLRFFTSKL